MKIRQIRNTKGDQYKLELLKENAKIYSALETVANIPVGNQNLSR